MNEELCFLSIREAGNLIRKRELSPVELTQAFLRRIEAIDPQLNAYLLVTSELAQKQARIAESEITHGNYRGPLHGIPFALKDMFDTAQIRTTAHSKILKDNVPARDATVVGKLYAAGGVLLGKLATHEFAHGGPSFDLPWPPARNPWNPTHFTGGSSSGSAAAVAAGLAMYSLGTDTGGSVRSPSWLCGIVGMKPTFGLISRTGVVPFSSSCDHVGPMTWSVQDCVTVLQEVAGHDNSDSGSSHVPLPPLPNSFPTDLRGIRLGVVRHFWERDLKVNPELCTAVDAAIEVFRKLGAQIEDIELRSLHDYYAVRLMVTESEMYEMHLKNLQERAGDYGHHFLSRCLPACLYTAADYIAAQRDRGRIIREMQPIYEKYDALITAGAGPAPSLHDHKTLGSADKFLRPGLGTLFSVTGAPALALCCGFSESGLPLGLQIGGRLFGDVTVLKIAYAYEKATPWRDKRPVLKAGAVAPKIRVDADSHIEITADEKIRELAEKMTARAGLKLTRTHFDLLLETAPYAMQLVGRLRRNGIVSSI